MRRAAVLLAAASLAGCLVAASLVGCGGETISNRREEGEVRSYLRTVLVEGRGPTGSGGAFRSEVTTKETTVEVFPGERIVSEALFERIRIELRMEGEAAPQVFDSKDPPPAADAPVTPFSQRTAPFRRLAGAKVTMRQKPTGKLEGFEGVEALRERMLEGVGEGDPVRPGIERLVTPASLEYMLRPNLLVPDGTMSVGDTLEIQDIRPMPETAGTPGLLYLKGRFRLAEVKDGKARVEVEGEVSLDPGPKMPPWPPAYAKYRGRLRLERGVFKGWARIALEKGVLEEDEHRTELSLFYVKPDGSGELAIPQTVTQSTKLR